MKEIKSVIIGLSVVKTLSVYAVAMAIGILPKTAVDLHKLESSNGKVRSASLCESHRG